MIRALVFGLLLAGLTGIAAADSAVETSPSQKTSLVPLKLKLPKPMFEGTPTNIRSANLEKITGKRRPPFFAPKGVTNVALKKPVSASDDEPILGRLDMLTDGEKEGGDAFFVEFGPGKQWVQIDLGAPHKIYAILIWHFHAQARVYRDVIVRLASDPDFIETKTLFNNDHDNSAGLGAGKQKEYIETFEGRLIDAKGAVGRYLRLYSSGNTSNDLNHYIEIEVYGKPVM
jgi:hypothetical protein